MSRRRFPTHVLALGVVIIGGIALVLAIAVAGLFRPSETTATSATSVPTQVVSPDSAASRTAIEEQPPTTGATPRLTATPTPNVRRTGSPTPATRPATSRAAPSRAATTTSAKPKPPTTSRSATSGTRGQATYYAPAAPGGACMTLSIPASRYTAAVGPAEFAGSKACGSYLSVTGARGTILVKVDNLCPECATGHIDLSTEAFAALDDPVKGVVPISYRTVRNPAVSGNIVVQVKDGSNPYWLALQLDNIGNALQSVAVAGPSGAFRSMTRSQNAFWVLDDNPGSGPFRVRLTDVAGHVVTLTSIDLKPGVKQTTSAKLY
ncbi:MAG: hypothetical protein IPK24_15345 [Kineosporiaceae bacterium]|nr:hypothetical protein [Kineosporiaceae bacterium]